MSKVISFAEKKAQKTEQKRRNFERVMFGQFLGCSTTLDHHGTHYPVTLIDLSKEGASIQIPHHSGAEIKFKDGSELTLRFYFMKDQYLEARVTIKHHTVVYPKADECVVRFGCEFDSSHPDFMAIKSFIDFTYLFAEHAKLDKGDSKVFFL